MSHLDEGQLAALLDDELEPDEKRAVEAHLAGCMECRSLWDETRALAAEADRLVAAVELPPAAAEPKPALPAARPAIAPAKPGDRPLPWRTLAWAASILLAVGLGYSLRNVSRSATGTIASQPANTPVPAERADEPVATPAAEPPMAPAARREQAPAPAAAAAAANNGAADQALAPKIPTSPAPGKTAPPAAVDEVASGELKANTALGRSVNAPPPLRGFAPSAGGSFRQVNLEEAVRALAGSIRLVDGLDPLNVLAAPGGQLAPARPGRQVIRVVYEDPPGRELWLDQQRASPESESARSRVADALLPGDTLLAPGEGGSQSVRWRDQHGFLLTLTGFLPGDSLRAMIPRVH